MSEFSYRFQQQSSSRSSSSSSFSSWSCHAHGRNWAVLHPPSRPLSWWMSCGTYRRLYNGNIRFSWVSHGGSWVWHSYRYSWLPCKHSLQHNSDNWLHSLEAVVPADHYRCCDKLSQSRGGRYSSDNWLHSLEAVVPADHYRCCDKLSQSRGGRYSSASAAVI